MVSCRRNLLESRRCGHSRPRSCRSQDGESSSRSQRSESETKNHPGRPTRRFPSHRPSRQIHRHRSTHRWCCPHCRRQRLRWRRHGRHYRCRPLHRCRSCLSRRSRPTYPPPPSFQLRRHFPPHYQLVRRDLSRRFLLPRWHLLRSCLHDQCQILRRQLRHRGAAHHPLRTRWTAREGVCKARSRMRIVAWPAPATL
jgi:hypothetical protein